MASATAVNLPPTTIPLPADAIRAFCDRWRVTEFALFGSVLRHDFRADSDVDVMVTFEPEARHSFYELVDMQDELEAMFGRPVDLLTRAGVESMVNWYRRRAILNTAKVVYAR